MGFSCQVVFGTSRTDAIGGRSRLYFLRMPAYYNDKIEGKITASRAEIPVYFDESLEISIGWGGPTRTNGANERLKDAKVKFKRTDRRGNRYSIAEEAVYQFFHWEDMPWES